MRGSSTSRAPAAAITGRAFTKHSSSSRSATESATIPPPAPIQIRSPRSSSVRIATFSSSPATGLA